MGDWLDLLYDTEGVRAVYGDDVPSLDKLTLHTITYSDRTVTFGFDFARFPSNPPRKWHGLDTVRTGLEFWPAENAVLHGKFPLTDIDLLLSGTRNDVDVAVDSPALRFSGRALQPHIMGPSAHDSTAPSPAGVSGLVQPPQSERLKALLRAQVEQRDARPLYPLPPPRAEQPESWLDLVENTAELRSVYGARLPTLDAVELNYLCIDRDEQTVKLSFELAGYPTNPPVSWIEQSHNTVKVALTFHGAHSVAVDSWEFRNIVDLTLEKTEDTITATVYGPRTDITIAAESVSLSNLSAYQHRYRSGEQCSCGYPCC